MTRAEIIAEIKRTTAVNGGIPLGSRRFATETGIGDSEWKGKYWARWSDAIKEAGYEPNQMTRAHGEAALLEKYARLAMETGRLPTNADIRLRINTTGLEFPDWNTYARQFGSKTQLVAKLREFCEGRPEFNGVLAYCDEYVPRSRGEPGAQSDSAPQIGFVYLIKHGSRREYKLGRTNNALRRAGEIAIEMPERVQPVHVIRTDDPAGVEAYWHGRFADKRKNGEWFDLTPTDVAAFKRWKRIV